MGGHDDERADGRQDRVKPGRAETDAEHDAQKVKEECAAHADDDRLDVAIVGETGAFTGITDDASDDHGSEKLQKHLLPFSKLGAGRQWQTAQKIGFILWALACALQAQKVHRAGTAGHF